MVRRLMNKRYIYFFSRAIYCADLGIRMGGAVRKDRNLMKSDTQLC